MSRKEGETQRAVGGYDPSHTAPIEEEYGAPEQVDYGDHAGEDAVDAAIEMTFPASDPPAWMG